MSKSERVPTRDRLLDAATLTFRRLGYDAASVDEICTAAGLTKGAFFHYFDSKENLAAACLERWDRNTARIADGIDSDHPDDAAARLFALLDRFIAILSDPRSGPPSCLAGTIVQEVAESNPRLRDAAQTCFVHAESLVARHVADAAAARGIDLDAASLARLWMAAIQGGLILFKASQNPGVLSEGLRHIREYMRLQLESGAP